MCYCSYSYQIPLCLHSVEHFKCPKYHQLEAFANTIIVNPLMSSRLDTKDLSSALLHVVVHRFLEHIRKITQQVLLRLRLF